jgi:parallel beta-helix repeat protein
MTRFLTLLSTGLLIGCLSTTAVLADAEPIIECGTLISEPGKYELKQDLLLCPWGGITISSSNVNLKLKGHTITCDVYSGTSSIHSGVRVRTSTGYSDIHIKNGTVTGCNYGVYLVGANDSEVTNMTLNGNRRDGLRMMMGSNNVIKKNVLIGNSGNGIFVTRGSGHKISHNITSENGSGIGAYLTQNTKYTCNQSNRNSFGIELSGAEGGNVVSGNVASGNSVAGIILFGYLDLDWPIPEGNTIKYNVALANYDKDLSENMFSVEEGPYVEDGAPCRNTWIDNEFVTELGPEMCIGAPAQLDDDDVCALDDDGDDE